MTLVSTSTNLVVSGMMVRYQMPAMRMFELTPVGLPIALAGLAYVWVIGRRLLPARAPAAGPEDDQFGLRPYLTEVLVRPDSALAGKTLAESSFGRELDLIVLRIVRDGKYHRARATTRLEAGDVLLVEGRREEILRIKDTAGIDIRADAEFGINDPGADGLRLAEGILMPRSTLIGRTLKGTRFRERYGVQVLAINRHDAVLRQKLSDVRLATGDVLLVQGPPDQLRSLDSQNVRILGAVEDRTYNLSRARTSVLIFAGVLAVGTLGWIPFPVAVLIGVVLALASRCITPEEAYREVEWKVIVLIGSMLAVGQAMDRTHAAEFLAGGMIDILAGASPVALLGGFFALTVLLTQPMSNQAAAIVVLPIAVQAAQQLSLNPRTFAMMVAVASSCSFLTPLEPSCLMVYGPGRYRFSDFLKVGSLLTVIIFLIAIALVPRFWPLAGPVAR
jgi:di/tricarboxylate transporter